MRCTENAMETAVRNGRLAADSAWLDSADGETPNAIRLGKAVQRALEMLEANGCITVHEVEQYPSTWLVLDPPYDVGQTANG